jgi:hypothetical protein
VFAVDSLKNFPYIFLQEHHFIQTAYKRQGSYVRDTEIFPELEVSSEIKVQIIKKAEGNVMRLIVSDSNIGAIIGQ